MRKQCHADFGPPFELLPVRAACAAANFAAAIWSGIECAEADVPSVVTDCGFFAASAMSSGVISVAML
jgi:hypothetical protein